MIDPISRRRRVLSIGLVVACLAASVTLAVPETSVVTLEQVNQLARKGQFDQILDDLKAGQVPALSPAQSAPLIADLETYRQHELLHQQQNKKAYDTAWQAMLIEIKAGRYRTALIKAIDAHSQATDPAAMLADPQIIDLVGRCKQEAQDAEKTGDWLDALALWRDLDLLYLDQGLFRQQIKSGEDHVRLLRLYTPGELQRLNLERQKKDGNESPEPLDLGSETWQERLHDVDRNVLDETIRDVRRHHIDGQGYGPLLEGGIDHLSLLLDTPAMGLAFGSLKDEGKVAAMRKSLASLREDIDRRQANLSYFDATHAVDSILDANSQSVKLPEQAILYEFTEGVMSKLDEFSAVIWPYDLTQFNRNTTGKFSGVGIQISRPGLLTVEKVEPKSPAAVAGLLKGDIIVRINDQDTNAMGIDEASRTLGAAGGSVKVRVERIGAVGFLEPTLTVADHGSGLKLSRPGKLVVVSPLPGTPAYKAGIKPNDVIAQVNGKNTAGWSLDQAVREITGAEGTKITLGIDRPGHDGIIPFELTRTSIEIDSVRGWAIRQSGAWDYYVDPQRKIGYVRISQFIPQTTDDLDAAINQMEKESDLQALVIDLRFNPGGLLRQAVSVVDRFVHSGRIVSTVDATGQMTSEYLARADNTQRRIPLAVLVNPGSASASEIVSGALQDYQVALIIGQRSFGKGSVQDLYQIDDDKALLKLTTQYYKLPLGRIIHRKPDSKTWGIEPDMLVPMTELQTADAIEFRRDLDVLHDPDEKPDPAHPLPKPEDVFTKSLDPQLEAAILYLKVQLLTQKTLVAHNPAPAAPVSP